jgi:hypothetical protein
MSRLQLLLLRWLVSRAVWTRGEHVLFEIFARKAAECWYEDNWQTLESWAHERLSVGFHNARRAPSPKAQEAE